MESAQESLNNTERSIPPSKKPKPTLWTHLRLSFQIWGFKLFVRVVVGLMRTFRIAQFAPRPSYIKHYPVGTKMWNDVWLPPGTSSNSKNQTERLPLYIDVHGGGFAFGDPRHDADFCNYLSSKHGIVVVSVNYPKAPLSPFPHAREELVKVVKSVLDDESLPVDRSKVALGGFSAGANLSLSIALEDELQGRLRGLLLWYPVTDFSGQYKGAYRTASDGSPDALANTAAMFNYAYVRPGQDLKDPRLSPVYADRKRLPPKIFFIGAEHDYLCHEAEKTAELYAAQEEVQTRIGDENDWTIGSIRWKKYLDVQHGFNFTRKRDAERERYRQEITRTAYADCAKWLKEEIYA